MEEFTPEKDFRGIRAAADPAGSRTQQNAARSEMAIACVAWDRLSRIFVLEVWSEQTTTTGFTDKVLEIQERWRPGAFGLERASQQSHLEEHLLLEARRRNIFLPLVPVEHGNQSKYFRVESILQPVHAEGRLIIGDHMYELKEALGETRHGHVPDVVDALAMAVSLVPAWSTPEVTDMTLDESAQLRHFYHLRGTRPARVAERIAQIEERRAWLVKKAESLRFR